MTSVEEVRATLLGAVEHIDAARGYAGVARHCIAEAIGVLEGLGEQHSEPLVPPELRRASDEIDRGLDLIAVGQTGVADIAARL